MTSAQLVFASVYSHIKRVSASSSLEPPILFLVIAKLVGSQFSNQDQTGSPAVRAQSPDHWTSRESQEPPVLDRHSLLSQELYLSPFCHEHLLPFTVPPLSQTLLPAVLHVTVHSPSLPPGCISIPILLMGKLKHRAAFSRSPGLRARILTLAGPRTCA